MNKCDLRSMLRNERNKLFLNNNPIFPVPKEFAHLLKSRPITAGYAALGSEADPAPLLEAARTAGCTIALPRVTARDSAMTFHSVEGDQALQPGPLGLMQPPAEAPVVTPALVLLPLLGFTRGGARLGQGAGHYDRALALMPNALRVGIAWSMQEIAEIAADPWDVPLHFVATEKEWIRI